MFNKAIRSGRLGANSSFRNYFILGIVGLSLIFFLYSNLVTRRLEKEISQFSTMLATFVAQLPAIPDKEASEAARKILDNLEFPFIITDSSNNLIAARGVGHGLREKIIAGTLTREDKERALKMIKKMDEMHNPIPMQIVEQDRRIIGYIFYDQTDWSLNQGSSFVITDVSEEPIFWQNITGTEKLSQPEVVQASLRSFTERAKSKRFMTTIQFNPVTKLGYFHYGNTGLIHQIRWWVPLAQIGMVVIFLIIGFIGDQKIKLNEQQAIWVGLAKETAHQLGTPISSLMGWVDILKEKTKDDQELIDVINEMQKDIERLHDITSRFGEIGSVPKRELMEVSEVIHRAVVYFQRRLPNRRKHVEIIESYQDNAPKVAINENLLQWVIENLIRNSLDAMNKERGRIQIRTEYDQKKKSLLIIYKDNGKGIEKKDRKKIFTAGYSTKKHGWGLGLAIVKRIIEGYHNGKIRLKESGVNGSTFEISLPVRA